MGKKGTKKRTQWRTLSITEQDEINALNGTAYISNGNSTTGINIGEASSVDDNFKYSGTNFSYLKRKSSAFSPSSNNYFNNNNSNRNDHFRINSYNNTNNTSYYYNNKHNSSSINNNNNNFIAINTTSNASSINNDTSITTTTTTTSTTPLNSNNIRYTRSLSSSSRYSYNNNNNNNNNCNNINRHKPYSMQNGGSLSSTSKYYSSYGAGRATSRANRTSYTSFNKNNLNKSNNELSTLSISSSSTVAAATNKENCTKPLFNEDDYTRITTPRQDVIFKKGYLSRPKPPSYLSSTSDTNTTSSATASIVSEESLSTATSVPSSLSPEQCSSIHSDSIVDPEHAFMYSYIDQNGILYVNPFVPPNGFDHYPGQMFMMPYGYSPYNFCPPDLNTPSTSDIDNETTEHEPELSTENIQEIISDETDTKENENNSEVPETIKSPEIKESPPQTTEIIEEIDTTKTTDDDDNNNNTNNDNNKDNSEENSEKSNESKPKLENEPTIDLSIDHNNKFYHPYMRNNCDPNFINYGGGGGSGGVGGAAAYSAPPLYPQFFYPINYYSGPPIMPFIGSPPYELHPEIINEEVMITEVEGENQEMVLNEIQKTECDNPTIEKPEETNTNQTENEINLIEESTIKDDNTGKEKQEDEPTTAVSNSIEIQESNENIQSCDADDLKSSKTQETEHKQQVNLNVNVDEFVPRNVIKPHLNVNVKEFQPRYLQKNYNTPKSNSYVVSNNNRNIESVKRVNNTEITTDRVLKENSLNVKDERKIENSVKEISTNTTGSKSSQKSVPTLAEQIKRSLAMQNDTTPSSSATKQQSKIFQNSNNNNRNKNNNNNKFEIKDMKSNLKTKDKLTKTNIKTNINKNKINQNVSNKNSISDKNNNQTNNNKTLNNIKTDKNSVLQQEKLEETIVKPTTIKIDKLTTTTSSTTNALSYAQMLNRDLIASEDKTLIKDNSATNKSNPANSSENELDDAEVQMLIKSLETAEKMTAMKENVCWQTVKSRGKRSKQNKENNNNNYSNKDFIENDFMDEITSATIATSLEEIASEINPVKEVQIVKEEILEIETIKNTSDDVKNENDNSSKIENNNSVPIANESSMNKGSEKKKSKQKNKKSTKKSPNAKKSLTKETTHNKTTSESINEINVSQIKTDDTSIEFNKLENNEILGIDEEDIDDNKLAMKLFQDLEKELDMKLKSNSDEEDENEKLNTIGNSSDNLLMKHSTLGRSNLDMLNGFDYKYKTKNILKEEEEMVLNVIKSLSSNSSSPIGCNKKSDNIFNASFIALNGNSSQSLAATTATTNSFGNIRSNLCEDPKNLIRKSSCLENISISTQNYGKSKQNKINQNNNSKDKIIESVVDVLNNITTDNEQHEDFIDTNSNSTQKVPNSLIIKKEEANSEYIQNCIKESLKWIQKMESVEKSIDNLDEIKSSLDGKILDSKDDKEEQLVSNIIKQNKKKEKSKNKEISSNNVENKKHKCKEEKILTKTSKFDQKLDSEKKTITIDHQSSKQDVKKNEKNYDLPLTSENKDEPKTIVSKDENIIERNEEEIKPLNNNENITEESNEILVEKQLLKEEIKLEMKDFLESENNNDQNQEKQFLDEEIKIEKDNLMETKNEDKKNDISIESSEETVSKFNNEKIEEKTHSEKINYHTESIASDLPFEETNGETENRLQYDIDANSDTESVQNEIIESNNEEICQEINTVNIKEPDKLNECEISDIKESVNEISHTDIEHQLEMNLMNGHTSVTTVNQISNGFSKYHNQDSKLEGKLNAELLNNNYDRDIGLNCIKDINQNIKQNSLNGLTDITDIPDNLSCDIVCNQVNGIHHHQNGNILKNNINYKKFENLTLVETDNEILLNSNDINKIELPLYNGNNNSISLHRERLSHSCSDTNDELICLNGLDKHKSTSSLALQLQQLEEQLKKLDRLATTPPLVCDEHRNGYYNSENDLNSLESSETNSSTLEDSLTSPKNEMALHDDNIITSCSSSGNEYNINEIDGNNILCNNHIKINNEPIIDTKYPINLDLNSSNRNSKDCDNLKFTNFKNSNDKSSKLFPLKSHKNDIQSASIVIDDYHDPKKFPITLAVKEWLAQEIKEKTPEPILRLPDDPNLNTRIKSSLSLYQLHDDEENNENYYHENDCWSITDSEDNENYDDETEIEENDNTDTETNEKEKNLDEMALIEENKIKKPKNLKSNPLHVSSHKLNNHNKSHLNQQHHNDNDSDYNSDSQITNKFDIYDDNNTCERVANNKINKSDENISTSSEQQIDYYWDDFIENPSKYLQNSKRNINNNNNNNIDLKNINRVNHRNTINNTSLDTMESRFSSGTSSMNELHDITPYESVYGKTINYNKLLENNYELLSNNIISFNNNDNNIKNNDNDDDNDNDNDNDDEDDDNDQKKYFNKKIQNNNLIAINYNKNDTSLNKNINLNNNNNNNNNSNDNNKDNCIKPPEVCCMLM